jgi:metal-responsive CopG/Arc/MetJ family transcriptional regulator
MRNKIIQVPVPQELLDSLDSLTKKQGKSRSAVIREACATYIAATEEAERVRQYVEGYKRMPEGEEEEALAIAGEAALSELLADDEW